MTNFLPEAFVEYKQLGTNGGGSKINIHNMTIHNLHNFKSQAWNECAMALQRPIRVNSELKLKPSDKKQTTLYPASLQMTSYCSVPSGCLAP